MPTNNQPTLIPKVIHYCWFGGGAKSVTFIKCIESWKKYCTDYEIIERNEHNYGVYDNPITSRLYQQQKRAFLVDYVRFDILYQYGGIYVDTDIQIVKSLDDLMQDECFMGFEGKNKINGAIIGSMPYHDTIKHIMDYGYHKPSLYHRIFPLLPNILTGYFAKHGSLLNNQKQYIMGVYLYSQEYFYPFDYYILNKDKDLLNGVSNNTYTIHRNDGTRLPTGLKIFWFRVMRIWGKIFRM